MTKPVINVTPLIDVLLVLLIIFMVVTPMKPAAFKAKIPKMPAKNDIVSVHPDTLVVIVSEDRSLASTMKKALEPLMTRKKPYADSRKFSQCGGKATLPPQWTKRTHRKWYSLKLRVASITDRLQKSSMP